MATARKPATRKRQNTTHAVMNQRHEDADALDFYPTPPWGTRALLKYVIPQARGTCFEPAAGAGAMVLPLREVFTKVYAADIERYPGFRCVKEDFLKTEHQKRSVDWLITNPPFNKAEDFIKHAIPIVRKGCAFLVRTNFMETVGRYERLFSVNPPTYIAQFSERLPMRKGRLDRTMSTTTSYAWFVWLKTKNKDGTRIIWIPPCRKELELDSDYARRVLH